jgi:GR25 family glycosyltransferase involved in LPS biosynthesis
MKSRELFTIHDLIASNYTISKLPNGKFLHSFTPQTSNTVYEFEANSAPVIEEGERYNIGFSTGKNGGNIIDLSALSKTAEVNPFFSYAFAQQIARENQPVEKAKNDQRVTHQATDGYYWGKKYAWRMFGAAISKDAFYSYLEEINHPTVPCVTNNPDLPYQSKPSKAYKEEGLEEAMRNLVSSAIKASPAYHKSPLYSRKLSIKGVKAITDKK